MSATGDRLGARLPKRPPSTDPAKLEAWYGNFGFYEQWRPVVLANCREMERALAATRNEKVSEARLDDLAKLHTNYLDFLLEHMAGREAREQNVKDSLHT